MKRFDHPDPRLASPIEPAIKEPSLPGREIFRDDWVNDFLSMELDALYFHAFGGAI